MKAHYKTRSGQLVFEVTAEDPKGLFAQIADLQEVFEAEVVCGLCKGTDIRLNHRKSEDFHFYELLCLAAGCHARFAFGQAKQGGRLFPKRKDEAGNWLPNNGWAKYVRPGSEALTHDGGELPHYTRDTLPDAGTMALGQQCMYYDAKTKTEIKLFVDEDGWKRAK
jgi:hypothetical protein